MGWFGARTTGMAAALAIVSAPSAVLATVFTASTSIDISEAAPSLVSVSLPQFSGSGVITKVVLSISGTAGGVNYYAYNPQDGITVPSGPASWNVELLGPDLALVANPAVNTFFKGGTIPGCGPSCPIMAYADFGPVPKTFSGSGLALDLADFSGTGTVQLGVVDTSSYDENTLTGTVTETIITSVVEPSTWSLLLVGAGLAGAALRRRRSANVALPR
jgi:hypothetical protein